MFGYFSKAARQARAARRLAEQQRIPHWREVIVIKPLPQNAKPAWSAPKVSEDGSNKNHKNH